MSPRGGQPASGEALDESVRRHSGEHVELLRELVAVRSLAGGERPAQDLIEHRLLGLDFTTRRLALTGEVEQAAGAGRPRHPPEGRVILVGERLGLSPTSLVLNGHVDVVPPCDEVAWLSPPFCLNERDGWLYGRGAGDMKGGIIMALLALTALFECSPQSLDASLAFVLVPEEESSGNGTLGSILQGVRGDVALLPEPTDLQILVSGVGVLWCRMTVRGSGAHAGSGSPHVNPTDSLFSLIERVRSLQARFSELCPEVAERGQVLAVNLGSIHAGDWPSSVPAFASADMRVGFPETLTPADAEEYVRAVVAAAGDGDEWLEHHPPQLDFSGLRAEPHRLDPAHALVGLVQNAHRQVHGAKTSVIHGSATSDARFYLNQADMPALCYGPRTKNIHGIDEAVELESIVSGARALTRAIPAILASDPEAFR